MKPLKVLYITSEWPTPEHPDRAPFIVQQVEFLKKAGLHVEVFFFRGRKNPLNYLKARRAVKRKLKINDYDIVHAQFAQSALLVIPCSIPLIVTFRGSDVLGIVGKNGKYTFFGKILRLISRLAALLSTEAIVVSKSLIPYLPKRKQYHIIPSGINLELFKPANKQEARDELGLPLNDPIVLFGARPNVPTKRYELAKKAVSLLKQRFPEVKLIALNNVSRNKVPLIMNASDVLLLCSAHEGSPNTVKEALACNIPVVSTDVGDVKERIKLVKGCIICKDDSPEAISNALYKVLLKKARINGRDAVINLDEKLLTEKVIEIYYKAMSINNLRRSKQTKNATKFSHKIKDVFMYILI